MRIIDFDGNERPINISPIDEGGEACEMASRFADPGQQGRC